MRGNRTEVTSSETSPVGVHGKLYHVKRRYPLALVARMRLLGERKVPERIHVILACRRISRINLHVAIPHRLHKHRRMHHVRISFYYMEILSKRGLVTAAAFERIENYSIFYAAAPVHTESKLRYLPDVTHITSGLDCTGKLQHRPLPHAVA